MPRPRALVVVALIVTAAGIASVVWVGTLLTRPVQVAIGSPPPDLSAEAIRFESASGTVVHGWFASVPNAKGSVLLLPGVRANRLSMLSRAIVFRRAGYNVLLIDFQATGETHGSMITFGWREKHDVLAAARFLRERQATKLVIVGTSLGGAAALFAEPQLRADAFILEAVYPDVEQATKNRLRIYLGPLGPITAPLLLGQLRFRLGVPAGRLRPIDHLRFVRCPVLFIGGSEDRHTTPRDTAAMYAAARPPKELWMVRGAAHVDFHRFAGKAYEARVLGFLEHAAR